MGERPPFAIVPGMPLVYGGPPKHDSHFAKHDVVIKKRKKDGTHRDQMPKRKDE